MHIVYALDTLTSGGSQREVVETCRYLKRSSDHRVSVFAYSKPDFFAESLREIGVEVVLMRKHSRLDAGFPLRVGRWLHNHETNVVHALGPFPSLWYLLAVRSLSRSSRPLFIAYEISDQINATWSHGVVQRFVYRMSDAVTVNSRRAEREIHTKLGVPRKRIHYVANGHDLEAWDRAAEDPCPFDLDPAYFNVVLVGRFSKEKNHCAVLGALDFLGSERIRNWKVWFIGSDSGQHQYVEQLRAEIRSRGLENSVVIAPSTSAVAAVMRRADVMVLPSLFEGLPNVLLEAMASRLPVVASPVGDIPEVISDGENGFLLRNSSAEELATKLMAVKELSARARDEMGRKERAVVEARYQISTHTGAWLALYEALANRR